MDDRLSAPPELTLVTGASGWFGRNLLRSYRTSARGPLARPGRIRALVPVPEDVAIVTDAAEDVEVFVGDIADESTLERFFRGAHGSSVVHAAGVIHPRHCQEFERVNVGGTTAIVAAAVRSGVRRLVHVSSNSPFGVNPTHDDVFSGEEPYRPYMGYGRSKMQAELAVKAAPSSLETVIIRPPWFYGPAQPARQTSFFTMIRKGVFPIMGDGRQRRSMTYVDNLALGVALAERHIEAPGNAYWIADVRPYSINEIVDTVAQVMQEAGFTVSSRRLHVPGVLGTVAERVDAMLQARGRYQQAVHVLGEMDKTIACSVRHAQEHLGYKPQIDLAEGMRRSIEWCAAHGVEL